MPSIRRVLAAGLLQGLGAGLEGANESIQQRQAAAAKALEEKNKATNLQKEYEFIEGLNDPDAQDRALKIKSAGNLTLDPKSGKYLKYKTPGSGKGKGGDSTAELKGLFGI